LNTNSNPIVIAHTLTRTMDLNGTFHTLLVINGYQIKQFSATPLKLTTDTVINTTCLMITITTNPSYNNQIAKMLFYAIIYN
jgi:hypothetical protein